MDDFLCRWKTITLTEKEEIVIDVGNGDFDALLNVEDIQLCAVAKVLAVKKINAEAFKAVMIGVWKVHSLTRFEIASDNVFFIQFRSMIEKARIMNEGPWTFDRYLVFIEISNCI